MSIWFSFAAHLLAGLALLVVGLAVVRPRSGRSGWLIGASGGLLLLTSCCARVFHAETLARIPTAVTRPILEVAGWASDVVVAALIALALIWLGESKSGG